MNKVIELTQKPLMERGWKFGEQTGVAIKERGNGESPFVGADKNHACAIQALADQPLLWEEITRLETALAEARNAALEEAAKIVEEAPIAARKSGAVWGDTPLTRMYHTLEQYAGRIRALSIPSAPTPE